MSLAMSVAYAGMFGGALLATAASLALIVTPKAERWGRWLVVVAAAAGTLGVVVRTIDAGHLPIFGTFENTFTASWALLLAAALASRRPGVLRASWRWAPPWVVALLLWGIRYRTEAVPLTISEQSLWVDVHVVFAWLAFTSLLGASSLSIVGLVRRDPEPDQAERADTMGRLLLVGFLSLTALIVLGSWVLYLLFGTFWKWEIVETLSLVAWIGYGLCVHVRLFHGWRGPKLYWSVLAVLPVLILAFWVWSVFPDTYHFFDIPLVRPY